MGLFSSKKPAPATPIRRDKVRTALKADMDFEGAIDRDLVGPKWQQVKKAHDDATKGLTAAERRYLDEARQRHGYGG